MTIKKKQITKKATDLPYVEEGTVSTEYIIIGSCLGSIEDIVKVGLRSLREAAETLEQGVSDDNFMEDEYIIAKVIARAERSDSVLITVEECDS